MFFILVSEISYVLYNIPINEISINVKIYAYKHQIQTVLHYSLS